MKKIFHRCFSWLWRHGDARRSFLHFALLFSYFIILQLTDCAVGYGCGMYHYFLRNFLCGLPLWLLFASIPFFLGKRIAVFYDFALLLSMTLTGVLAWLLKWRCRMLLDGDAVWVLAASSAAEAGEFCRYFFSLGWSLLLFAGVGMALWFAWRLRKLATALCAGGILTGVILSLPFAGFFVYNHQKGNTAKAFMHSVPGALAFGAFAFHRDFRGLFAMTQHPELPEKKPSFATPQARDLFGVIVIGESASRAHMSLYGYSRVTDPEMSKRKSDLLVFDDVLSAYSGTTWAIRYLFTQSTLGAGRLRSKCSLVDILHAAGFRVCYFSNQSRWGRYDGPVGMAFCHADYRRYLQEIAPGAYDDQLLKFLQEELGRSSACPTVVILHLQGSHFLPEERYPKSFSPFPAVPGNVFQSNLNVYDNSIAFTDQILGRIIDQIARIPRPSFMLYVSDHGAVIKDRKGRILRSPLSTEKTVYEIPMLLYLSPQYRQAFPEWTQNAARNVHQPLQTDHLFWGMVSLCQVDGGEDHEAENIFSRQYQVPRERFLRNGNILYVP